MGTISIVSIIN